MHLTFNWKSKQRLILALAAALLVMAFAGCGKKEIRRATVELRDGTRVTGLVMSSNASEMQIAGDDQVTRTVQMAQVRSVEYSDPIGAAVAAPAAPPHPQAASAITTKTFDLAPGTQIWVRNDQQIDSKHSAAGETFPAVVTRNVTDQSGDVVIPAGSNARIAIRSVSRGGKVKGAPYLVLDLDSVTIEGRAYELETTNWAKQARHGIGRNRRTGLMTGGGAIVGALIGGIAGGGKGAAIGAGAGAGAGALTQIFTRGQVKVPVESVLMFRLDQPLHVSAAS